MHVLYVHMFVYNVFVHMFVYNVHEGRGQKDRDNSKIIPKEILFFLPRNTF